MSIFVFLTFFEISLKMASPLVKVVLVGPKFSTNWAIPGSKFSNASKSEVLFICHSHFWLGRAKSLVPIFLSLFFLFLGGVKEMGCTIVIPITCFPFPRDVFFARFTPLGRLVPRLPRSVHSLRKVSWERKKVMGTTMGTAHFPCTHHLKKKQRNIIIPPAIGV